MVGSSPLRSVWLKRYDGELHIKKMSKVSVSYIDDTETCPSEGTFCPILTLNRMSVVGKGEFSH